MNLPSVETVVEPKAVVPLTEAVVHALADGNHVVVDVLGVRQRSRLAVPGYQPVIGDRVLVIRSAETNYVVGVLTALREVAVNEVADRQGKIVFDYDRESGKATVHIPDGDLEMKVARGQFRVVARDGVEMQAGVHQKSELSMNAAGLKFAGKAIVGASERVELLSKQVRIVSDELESRIQRVHNFSRVVESNIGRIIERAEETYREVEGLAQYRAGRLRWVAQQTAQLVSENLYIKARDRMKLKGKRIHLA